MVVFPRVCSSYIDLVTKITSFLSETFLPKILTDTRLAYSPKKWISVTLGANNIFDVYPDRLKDYRNTTEGMYIYSQEASPLGFNGGCYFVSLELKL
jgi:iron complex outermembrane receptor protein